MLPKRLLATAVALLLATGAQADCAFENDTTVRMLSASFPAWVGVTDAMKECGNVEAELNNEFLEKMKEGFAASPPLYHIGGLYGSAIIPLIDANLIRPLDDLVEKYGQNLQPNQLILVDGKIMAIAMMVNAQHLMYREDILNDLGIAVPTTYAELLEAAATIQESGKVDYVFGGNFKTAWLEFVNMYLGYGGEFFDENWNPTVNNDRGMKTLTMLKALTEYMDPEYLVSDTTYTAQQLQKKKIAMATLWASRAQAMDDPTESEVVGLVKPATALAPEAGMIPAATLWWDGVVFAAGISDEEADSAFRVAMEGLDSEMVQANSDAAIWLIAGYEAGQYAEGAAATAANGALPYPASTQMGLMQSAIANNYRQLSHGQRGCDGNSCCHRSGLHCLGEGSRYPELTASFLGRGRLPFAPARSC